MMRKLMFALVLSSLLRVDNFLWAFVAMTPPTSHGRSNHTSAFGPPSQQASSFYPNNHHYSIRDSWALIVLGDLHMEDDMFFHCQARDDCLQALQDLSIIPTLLVEESVSGAAALQEEANHGALPTLRDILHHIQNYRAQDLTETQLEMLLAQKRHDFINSYLVSLGDLGRREIRHEPGDAGTTKLFRKAKDFLDGFELPYELVSGNHDLEGLDEFDTDEANLQAWMDCFDKPTPQFCRQIGQKTLLLGLSTVRFRDAPQSSHEVYIDDKQIEWFRQIVESHPAPWKILVFSHAPIAGSGLRVIQDVHVVNGCAWINHSSEQTRTALFRIVQANPQIVAWFSGHFHLSQDFQDAISTVGTCTFVQVGVVGPGSTRDGRRQTRLVRGSGHRIQVYSINHHDRRRDDDNHRATARLDMEINTRTGHVFRAPVDLARDEDWFQLYTPRENDEGYIASPNGTIPRHQSDTKSHQYVVRWWRMQDGRVIGFDEQNNQLVEYDCETLAPIGIVRDKQALGNRQVCVVENGTAIVLVDHDKNNRTSIETVHPNNDGSYFRNYQRNKRIRQEEKRREDIAKMWLEKYSRENS